jgi:hypothetical protein
VNNLALFICGLAITLFSGLGVIVYTVSLGYSKPKEKKFEHDVDLGAVDLKSVENKLTVKTSAFSKKRGAWDAF